MAREPRVRAEEFNDGGMLLLSIPTRTCSMILKRESPLSNRRTTFQFLPHFASFHLTLNHYKPLTFRGCRKRRDTQSRSGSFLNTRLPKMRQTEANPAGQHQIAASISDNLLLGGSTEGIGPVTGKRACGFPRIGVQDRPRFACLSYLTWLTSVKRPWAHQSSASGRKQLSHNQLYHLITLRRLLECKYRVPTYHVSMMPKIRMKEERQTVEFVRGFAGGTGKELGRERLA
jgi:hypothetical protein